MYSLPYRTGWYWKAGENLGDEKEADEQDGERKLKWLEIVTSSTNTLPRFEKGNGRWRQMQNDLQNVNKRTGETPKEIETRKSPQAKKTTRQDNTPQPTIPKKNPP